MVEVEVMEQVKCTEYKPATLSPVFNETLFFEMTNLRVQELETGMI